MGRYVRMVQLLVRSDLEDGSIKFLSVINMKPHSCTGRLAAYHPGLQTG